VRKKLAIGASSFAVSYLLFHPAQPFSHDVELKTESVGKIQTAEPSYLEVEPVIADREPSATSKFQIVFEK
jgi:hypothetical protein